MGGGLGTVGGLGAECGRGVDGDLGTGRTGTVVVRTCTKLSMVAWGVVKSSAEGTSELVVRLVPISGVTGLGVSSSGEFVWSSRDE